VEWVKTTAKTLPEAIDLALDNLGVDESEAEIVILEEPRPGLFGRMRGTARVEARVKPKAIRPKTDRSRGRRKGSEGARAGRNRNRRKGGEGGSRGERQEEQAGGRRAEGRDRSGSGSGRNGGGRSSGRGGRSRGRDRTGGEGGGGESAPRDGGRSEREERAGDRDRSGRGRDRAAETGQEMKPSEGASVDEVAAHLRTFLVELTEAFGFDSEVTIDDSEEDALVGRIEGRHGLLVGPKGRTLDAVQELARISCQRTVPSNIRIKVDVGGYREQRVAALAEFARKAADKAVADKVEVALEPMSPADRKAVHDALNGDARVETRSVGSEPRRKVLVVPIGDDEVDDDDDDELTEVEDTVAGESVGGDTVAGESHDEGTEADEHPEE
jgi:spoIIIJ-associated protein